MKTYINTCINGDAERVLKELPDGIIDCCVTSPPYYGLRDYGIIGQIGLEETPEEYVEKLVTVFREVRRVLAEDGTLWLNIGDSYAGSGKGPAGNLCKRHDEQNMTRSVVKQSNVPGGCKPKDLIGIPWMLAFALRQDGWYLRQDIIWAKPNPMPESVKDRCTKSHEYIFLFSKNAKYYYDAQAISEPVTQSTIDRPSQDVESQKGSERVPGKVNGTMKAVHGAYKNMQYNGQQNHQMHIRRANGEKDIQYERRNKRDVWTVATKPLKEEHFAAFPEELITPCILAGSRPDGIILDPFFGSGTTGRVAGMLNRNYIGIELNPKYMEINDRRTKNTQMVLDGFI